MGQRFALQAATPASLFHPPVIFRPPTAAAIADADPQVTGAVRLAGWAGLTLTAVDIGNIRLALMAALPNLSGLILAFGIALRRRARS